MMLMTMKMVRGLWTFKRRATHGNCGWGAIFHSLTTVLYLAGSIPAPHLPSLHNFTTYSTFVSSPVAAIKGGTAQLLVAIST